MKEEERAEQLARALEELLGGGQPHLDDPELQELLYLAQIRREAGLTAANASSQQANAVWQRLLNKLHQLREKAKEEDGGLILEPPGDDAAEDPDIQELSRIIRARRALSEQYLALSEEYKDAVWQRVQARLEARQARKKRFSLALPLSFWRRRPQEADRLTAAIDGILEDKPTSEAEDFRLQELIALARLRRAMGQAVGSSSPSFQARLWARLRPRLMVQEHSGKAASPDQPERSLGFPGRAGSLGSSPWPKLAAAAAVIALVIFAIGPLPATGLADHPVTQLFRFVRQHVGVTETGDTPAVTSPVNLVQGIPVTIEEAQERLGLPVREPFYLPDGYQKAQSLYFPEGITSQEGGMLLLAYEKDTPESQGPSILVYQERTSGNTVAVKTGFAESVSIAAGVQGTYVEGTWAADRGFQVVWDEEGGQSLVFDNGDIRTIILYLGGPKMAVSHLVYTAMSMLDALQPPGE